MKINYPLIIGSILLIVLLTASIYPDMLSTADPYGKQRLEFISGETGETSFLVPPVKPGKEYPWGTDHLGRDLRSLIIYGCKVTMTTAVFSALGRLLIALPLAISAAYNNRISKWFIKQFSILFSAFPLIILVLMLSPLSLFTDILKDDTLITIAILVLLGWGRLSLVLMEKASEILRQDFIEGEIAIGKSKLEIAMQNVIPHLIPTLIVMIFLEIALVLQTLAQIGVLGVVTTGGYYNGDGDLNIPFEFDWGSLLAFTYLFFGTDKMYLVIFPAVAFAMSIIGFNLFGEGLRLEFEKRTSRVITIIRSIPAFLSPLKFAYEMKNFQSNKRAVYIKTICVVLVLLIAFFPQAPSSYKFDAVTAFNNIETLSSERFKGRLAGTLENQELAEYVKTELEHYGLKPFDGKFIHDFDIKSSVNLKESTLRILDPAEGDKEFVFRKDFIVNSPLDFFGQYEVLKLNLVDLYKMNPDQKNKLLSMGINNKVVIIDLYSSMNYNIINEASQFIIHHLRPKAVILLGGWEMEGVMAKQAQIYMSYEDIAVISVSKQTGEELLQIGNKKVEISIDTDLNVNTKGYNVIGYIPASDENKKDEYLVIGSKLDFVGDDKNVRYPGAIEAGAVAIQMEIAKKLASSGIKPGINIVFAFWDGSYNAERGSKSFVKQYLRPGRISEIIYFDIGNLALKKNNTLLLDTSRVFPKNKTPQDYIAIIKENARKHDVKLAYGSVNSPLMTDLKSNKIQSLLISNTDKDRIAGTSQDTIEMIDKKRYKNIGQMLLDTIVEIARGK